MGISSPRGPGCGTCSQGVAPLLYGGPVQGECSLRDFPKETKLLCSHTSSPLLNGALPKLMGDRLLLLLTCRKVSG